MLGPGVPWLNGLLGAYADTFPAPAHPYELALWHGFGTALLLSAAAWAGGVALFVLRGPVVLLSRRVAWPTADRMFGLGLLGLERLALQVTGFFQRGSVSVYLATVLLVLFGGQLAVLVVDEPWTGAAPPRLWDSPVQGGVALLTCAAALLCLPVRRRMKVVVLAGLTGYGTALLFVVHGAPDLALTQFCVETVSLLVFVLVLRRMPVYFQETISRHAAADAGALRAGRGGGRRDVDVGGGRRARGRPGGRRPGPGHRRARGEGRGGDDPGGVPGVGHPG